MTNTNYVDSRTPEERASEPETEMTTATDNTNDLLNAHFEEQRIHDLKIDIEVVLAEIWRIYKNERNTETLSRLLKLQHELIWMKNIL